MPIPSEWLALNGTRRDVLLSLALDGPATIPECHDRIGGVDGNRHVNSTRRHTKALDDAGLIEPVGGHRYDLTDAGESVVDGFRAAVC